MRPFDPDVRKHKEYTKHCGRQAVLHSNCITGVLQYHHQDADVVSPAVGQVQSDAATYVRSKAHISYGSQADVEKGDDAHPQIQDASEALGPLHLVLQGKNLHKKSTVSPGRQTKTEKEQNTHIL